MIVIDPICLAPVAAAAALHNDATMDSGQLTPEQANRLRETVARHLRFLNKLCGRMQQLGFPLDDPLCRAAQEARSRVQDLHTAAHYAGCKHGVGRTDA